MLSIISTDPGLLEIRHSHQFVVVVIHFFNPNNRLTETCSLGLLRTSLMLDIHAVIN